MTDRTEQLQQWWDGLDDAGRAHARECAASGEGDAQLSQSLLRGGLGVMASTQWQGQPSTTTHVPRDVVDFVEGQG